jgi:hypothetical protein
MESISAPGNGRAGYEILDTTNLSLADSVAFVLRILGSAQVREVREVGLNRDGADCQNGTIRPRDMAAQEGF